MLLWIGVIGGFAIFNGSPLDFYKEELPRFTILSRNILNYLKEGKTLEEACAKAGVVQNELNIWKLWADKGLQPYADFFREIQNYRWFQQDMKINCNWKNN